MGNSKSALPYDIGDVVCSVRGPAGWVLHEGKRSRDGEPVSVFRFDKKSSNTAQAALAENFVKRLKTLRHPHILAYADGLDSDSETCVVTESVVPLRMWLQAQRDAGESRDKILAAVGWGMDSLLKAVGFINEDCKLCHGAISSENILVTKGGDWKLGGLFVIGEMSNSGPSSLFRQTPDIVANKYKPPERLEHKSQFFTPSGIDMWAVGAVLHEALNGPAGEMEDLSTTPGGLPRQLHKFHGLCMARSPSDRPGAKKMMTHAGFRFLSNTPLYKSLTFLDEWQLKTDPERVPFLRDLSNTLDGLPKSVCCYKVLPALRDAISSPGAGVPGAPGGGATANSNAPHPLTAVVLGPFLKITGMMSDEEAFQRLVVPTVVRLFSSPDRATRVTLLRNLTGIVEHVDAKTLNGQVFKSICTGFSDNAPQMREHTVKSIVLLAPKLDAKNLNEVLLRNLVLLLKDPEPAIRTNTLICLGKIIVHFNDETKKKVALGSFPQGARDQFVPARLAALRGLQASLQYVQQDDQSLAGKVIPGLAFALVDPSPEVRTLAFAAMQRTVDSLKEKSEARAVVQLKEQEEAKKREMEQRRVGELGGGGGPGNKSNQQQQRTGDATTGYFNAAAGWAGSMWSRSSSSENVSGAMSSVASSNDTNPAAPSPAPTPPPAARSVSTGRSGGMKLTPSAKKTLDFDMDDDGFGDGWGDDDADGDDIDLLSGGGNEGWGNADDEDLLTGSAAGAGGLKLGGKKKSSGHVEPVGGSEDFFGSTGGGFKPAGKLEVRLPKNKASTANSAARKAEAARKREESRARMAQRKEAKKKPVAVKKELSGGGDDWDNW